ncbi:MAG: hypothetical protein HY241_13260 [Actinobacteria bacterium]|nr:hypothetical protein [Actinomycetota bacterium]
MRLATLRRGRRGHTLSGVVGVARLDRRTANLTGRLAAGDIAIIDHVDLDRTSAEALVACRAAAVVNASPSVSGRYPNLGPEVLVAAGIPLVDRVGQEIFAAVRDGATIRLDGDTLYLGDTTVATGIRQTPESVAEAMEAAKEGLSSQLEAFAADTVAFMRRERALLLDGDGVPETRTELSGRHVVVVVRGFDDRRDLAALRPYIREYRPVLLGVDGGADILLDAGYRPDLVVGELTQVSDRALRCGAEVVARALPGDHGGALDRVRDLGVPALAFPSTGSSEDLALLLADVRGAALIVGVGTHATLTEFLDRGREVMASTFLTRLRIGGKLVDAKAVRQLYRSRISGGALLLLVLAAVVAVAAALAVSAAGDPLVTQLTEAWHRVVSWVGGLIR